MSHTYKLGLIGAGYWGKNLIRVFNELGVLKIICDLDNKILKQRKKEYPNLKTTTDFEEILADKEIKSVVISSPAVTHYNLVKKALETGKDVFVEKPLALQIKQGEELVKIANKEKRILMVGHLLLYHPAIIKLKQLIDAGKLGEIQYIWSNRLNFGKLRREENILWSFAPHDISVIIDILGEPKKILSKGKSYLQKNIADVSLSFLEFEKNKSAHIFVSWLNPFKEQKMSIIGSKAMAVFDDMAENKLVIYNHKVKYNGKYLQEQKANAKIIKFPNKEPLLEEAKHFLKCVKNRKNPITDGKQALKVLKVLDACEKSLKQ